MKVMGKKSCTYRQGVIVALNGTKARVQFINESACASCHAKAACGMGDTKLYEIDALVAEGLVEPLPEDLFRLPGTG